MNLQDYLDDLTREAESLERRYDLTTIIADAKRKGLIVTRPEARALQVAIGANVQKALPIDKSGGEVVADLAGVKTMWMDVTPAMAELWLKNNFNNRPVSMDTVRAYARDMVNMKWLPTHQGIAFNSRDELIDGQHRLLAIIMSGEQVRTLVTFGLPSRVEGTRMTAMDTVDRGKTRTVADQLRIQHQMRNGTVISMIAVRLAGICSPERTRRLSVGEVLDIHQLFEEPMDWIIARRPRAKGLKQAGVLAGFTFALAAEGTDGDVATMFENLIDGKGDEGMPIKLLHKFLTDQEVIHRLTRGNDRALAELVLQAIWQQKRGKSIDHLEQLQDGVAHFRILQRERVSNVAGMFLLPKMEAQAA